MGWKSTIEISKRDAIKAIREVMGDELENKSPEELATMMYELNIGDDPNLPYLGYNFNIIET